MRLVAQHRSRASRAALFACALAFAGCFQPDGTPGDPDADAGSNASAGGAGGAGECEVAGDCRLVDDRCCGCGTPTIADPIRAVPVDSDDFGAVCRVACGPCPELPLAPVTVIADCVDGTCKPVELSKQVYTRCEIDSECVPVPVSCCGWCGPALVTNSYAIHEDSGFDACTEPVSCPDIACPPTLSEIEAFCNEGSCAVRPPQFI